MIDQADVTGGRSLAGMSMKVWLRSRGPWLYLCLLAVFIWYDQELGGRNWWSMWIGAAALIGFLSGYDTFTRLREEGSLRLMLLRPVRRGVLAVGLWVPAGALAMAFMALVALYLLVMGEAPLSLHFGESLCVVMAGTLAFTAYAQLGSLLLPRDTCAVLGLLLIVLGTVPIDRWLAALVPEMVIRAIEVVLAMIPTVERLDAAFATDRFAWSALGFSVLHVVVGLGATTIALHRPRFMAQGGNG